MLNVFWSNSDWFYVNFAWFLHQIWSKIHSKSIPKVANSLSKCAPEAPSGGPRGQRPLASRHLPVPLAPAAYFFLFFGFLNDFWMILEWFLNDFWMILNDFWCNLQHEFLKDFWFKFHSKLTQNSPKNLAKIHSNINSTIIRFSKDFKFKINSKII